MNTLTVEGWCKTSDTQSPIPLEQIRFHINERCHRQLEAAEEELRHTQAVEKFVDVDMRELRLQTPAACGPLADCQLRVYLGGMDNSRGQFHLVGHRASDDSLVYTNAVMVDQLG